MAALKGLLAHCRGMTLGGPCSGFVAGQRFALNSWRLAGESNGAFSAAAFHTTAPCQKLRMRGTVVSDGAQKTVVVAVERIYKHPVVKKYVKTRSKFMAHDELDQFKVGDEIWIEEHRPISARKNFMATDYVDPSMKAKEVPPGTGSTKKGLFAVKVEPEPRRPPRGGPAPLHIRGGSKSSSDSANSAQN